MKTYLQFIKENQEYSAEEQFDALNFEETEYVNKNVPEIFKKLGFAVNDRREGTFLDDANGLHTMYFVYSHDSESSEYFSEWDDTLNLYSLKERNWHMEAVDLKGEFAYFINAPGSYTASLRGGGNRRVRNRGIEITFDEFNFDDIQDFLKSDVVRNEKMLLKMFVDGNGEEGDGEEAVTNWIKDATGKTPYIVSGDRHMKLEIDKSIS